MDERACHGDSASGSTLILVDDAEYELHVSHATVTFARWGSPQAVRAKSSILWLFGCDIHIGVSVSCSCAKSSRGGCEITISLLLRESSQRPHAPAAIPLVITAPLTTRFTLSGPPSLPAPYMPLLAENCPLRYLVEFVRPLESDGDFVWDNFQDQVVIQARLGRLTISLCALRDASSRDGCSAETFVPRVLQDVKAPSFKLFDQIEKSAALFAVRPSSATVMAAKIPMTGSSFNPHKHVDMQLTPLDPARRQATPPHMIRSRPSSSERRTASPRTLEPLQTPPLAHPPPRMSADVTNQLEAKEVILRLRARRSTMNASQSTTITQTTSAMESPQQPESALDAKAQAELEQFNEIVVAAKTNVVQDMNKAKQELDYYKSLLPKPPQSSDFLSTVNSAPVALIMPLDMTQGQSGKKINKAARLPTIPTAMDAVQSQPKAELSSSNNQESSPVKQQRGAKQVTAPRSRTTKHTGDGEPELEMVEAGPPKHGKVRATPVARGVKTTTQRETRASVVTVATVPLPRKLTSSSTDTTTKAKKKSVAAKLTKATNMDDALRDFDDPDPEVDDAPILPDDLSMGRSALEEDDEMMLLMRIR